MLAIEIIHALKKRTKGFKGELTLKIDITNKYDRMNWRFLRGVLSRMGFSDKWVHWVMMCVTSVNYSILVNAYRIGPIQPGRGLRQGDPLPPYLFILVAKGISTLINRVVSR